MTDYRAFVELLRAIDASEEVAKNEKFLLLSLAFYGNEQGNAIYPTQEKLMKKTGLSERTLRSCERSLQKKGFLILVGRRNRVLEWRIPLERFCSIPAPAPAPSPLPPAPADVVPASKPTMPIRARELMNQGVEPLVAWRMAREQLETQGAPHE